MPIISRNWDAFHVDRVECPICGKPSRSERGNGRHYLAAHADSVRAERNWNIAMLFFEENKSVAEIAKLYNIGAGSVYTVLSNVALFQNYYELDPIFLERPKVIPLHRRSS